MISAENQARAAMRAIAATVDDAPPLRLAPAPDAPVRQPSRQRQQGRRWRTWIRPAAAAIAVAAIGLSLVVVRDLQKEHTAPAIPAGLGVPRYYVAVDVPAGNSFEPGAKVVVGDTISGKRLLTVGPFAGGGAVSVTAAADDRTFVVATQADSNYAYPRAWYLIHIIPGGKPRATVRQLPIHLPANVSSIGITLSPDGAELAMSEVYLSAARQAEPTQAALRIYSVATGQVLRTWTEPVGLLSGAFLVSWVDDGLAFTYETGANDEIRELRLLSLTRPGHDLLADSRYIWSAPVSGPVDLNNPFRKQSPSCPGSNPGPSVTSDGRTVVCIATGVFRNPGSLPTDVVCPAIPPWNDEGIFEYSTATGKLARTLYTQNSNCIPYVRDTGVLWVSGTGGTVIGYVEFKSLEGMIIHTKLQFGVFKKHSFTPLPTPPAVGDFGEIAW